MKSFSLKQSVLAGAAALTMVGAALGVAGAQGTPSASPTPVAPANRAPGGQATPADKQQHHQQFLNALAAKLNVTPERLQQAMEQTRTELGMPARGPGGPRGGGFGRDLDVAAQAIGISADQLRQDLPGRSLTQVAQARGKNPADVAAALRNAANQRIDQAVAAGRLTAEQAAQQKQQVAQRVDQQMNQVVPQGGPPARGGRGPRAGDGA